MRPSEAQIGEKVSYFRYKGLKPENGIIKQICYDTTYVWIVTDCKNDWGNYYDYNAEKVNVNELEKGWV